MLIHKYLLIFVLIALCLCTIEGGKRKNKKKKTTKPPPPPDDDRDYYDTEYPQYLYKPYTGDCNRREYGRYKQYLRHFKQEWYNRTKYPKYKLDSRQQKLWDKYGRYEYEGRYPTGTNKPGKGVCCYHFNGKLPVRRSPAIPRERIRQEYRTLSEADRNAFHAAMNSLKSSGGYDIFVNNHRESNSPHAHQGASFLPWHREFLFRLENALIANNYTARGLPYFDSTLDVNLPEPSDSVIWTDNYLGNINGVVNTGFASMWESTPDCVVSGTNLTRDGIQGITGGCYLFSDFDLDYVYGKRCFRDIVCNIDCKFEADHAGVHNFIGGHMANPSCAPSDPAFFLHHAFVDCIWEEFRQNHQESSLTTEYPSAVNVDDIGTPPPMFAIPNGFEWYSPMGPFTGLLNGHGIQTFYTPYYTCAPRVVKCSTHGDCKSKILWCNNGRCMAKVKQGGNCGSLPDVACAGPCSLGLTPKCINSICGCGPFNVIRNPVRAVNNVRLAPAP